MAERKDETQGYTAFNTFVHGFGISASWLRKSVGWFEIKAKIKLARIKKLTKDTL